VFFVFEKRLPGAKSKNRASALSRGLLLSCQK